jgi:DNA integrity scanning protein DisA with diadenylate cyclase activity
MVKETLINSANEMTHEAHGTQQPRHINKIGEEASTVQRSDSLVQSINQRFPNHDEIVVVQGRSLRASGRFIMFRETMITLCIIGSIGSRQWLNNTVKSYLFLE